MNIRVATTDRSEIALEVTKIDRVEAYYCDEEANVGLRNAVAYEVVFAFKYLLDFVQRFEDGLDGLLIRFLPSRETTFVYAVCKSGCFTPKSSRDSCSTYC